MKHRLGGQVVLLAILLFVLGTHVSAVPQAGAVHVTAVGDFGQTANTTAVLDAVKASGSDATFALGDLSYGTTGQEQAWCDLVTSRVGPGYPFELLSGNHESNGLNGNINDFSACLPNQLPGVVGTYGRQYFVDVPAAEPLVRFVMISPNLGFPDGSYDYSAGSPRYAWTAQAIDGARAAGIGWVVVGMHKPCLTVGKYACDVGADLFNLLVSKKVDLVLSGHEHTYQRTKQLALGAACPAVVPGRYDEACVSDGDNSLNQGSGTVSMVVGTGGNALYDITAGDAETGYFAASSGANANPTFGPLDLRFDATTLQASFLRASGGTFADSFTITRSTTPNTPPTAAFTQTCVDLSCTFDGSGSTDPDGTVSGYAWSFGDGGSGSGVKPAHSYPAPGSYPVTLTVTDDRGDTATTSGSVTVTGPAVTTYAADDFGRTVARGFGSAPTGGAWTNTGSTTTLNVSGTGNLVLPAAGKQAVYLASVSAPATDLAVALATDKPATGGGVQFTAFGRRVAGQGGYGARVKLNSTGAVSLELIRESGTGTDTSIQAAAAAGLTYAVGDRLNVRVQTVGTAPTTIRARVWKGATEPTTWLRTVTDTTAGLQAAGSVGLSAYVSSTATNAPLTVRVDDLRVTSP